VLLKGHSLERMHLTSIQAGYRERDRERETDRQTVKQTETDRQRQTESQTDRDRQTETEMFRYSETAGRGREKRRDIALRFPVKVRNT